MKIAMIMLAAGNSRRFGGNKLLYEIDGMPMYRHILDQLLEAENEIENKLGKKTESDYVEIEADIKLDSVKNVRCNITVVTQYEAIAETAREKQIQVLRNRYPEKGISSSIQIGLKANLDADAALFTVSDQPWLTKETICRLTDVFLNSKKGIACVSYQGKLGNPCIFGKQYFDELLALEGDKGGKKIIMRHLEDTQIYEVEDVRELEDIDYHDITSMIK